LEDTAEDWASFFRLSMAPASDMLGEGHETPVSRTLKASIYEQPVPF